MTITNLLQSTTVFKVMDLLSEGEIVGPAGGLQGYYLDNTPIQNPDGSLNFNFLIPDAITFSGGTQHQPVVPGFADSESEIGVSTQVRAGTPLVRQTVNPNITAVRVTVMVPNLTSVDSSGNVNGAAVELRVEIQAFGAPGYTVAVDDVISGIAQSQYTRLYRISLAQYGDPPYNVKVTRVTVDSTSSTLQDSLFWQSYTEIIDASFSYPNSAYVAMLLDARQFSSIPTRSYLCDGIRIQVPSNYNPVTRAYSGTWDGTFTRAYSNNPAWCFYDLLTSTRYGLGKFIAPSQVDKWGLYTIGQYCDELVPDGFGGMEPRFTMNVLLSTQDDAYKVLNNLASVFRAMIYWATGSISLSQDAPKAATMLYTAANVIEGSFSYQGSAKGTRNTVAAVTWFDPAINYQKAIEYVEDPEGIALFGVRKTEIVAVGCTSRGQAHRVGLWTLYTQRLETDLITFKTGLDTALVRPGDIIKIADPNRAGVRLGGRVTGSSYSSGIVSLGIDSPINLIGGHLYSIFLRLPDGGVVGPADLTNSAGSTSTLTFPLDSYTAPLVGAIFVVATDIVRLLTARVITVAEAEKNIFEISALQSNQQKYAAIEDGLSLNPINLSLLDDELAAPIPPVVNLTATEVVYIDGAVVKSKINVSFTAPDYPYTRGYQIQYQPVNGNVTTLAEQSAPLVEVLGLSPNIYTVMVAVVNVLGNISTNVATCTVEAKGITGAPQDITGFNVVALGSLGIFTWDQVTEIGVQVGGHIQIRYSPLTMGASWSNGLDIGMAISGAVTQEQLPLLTGTYMIKAFNSAGYSSLGTGEIIVSLPNTQDFVATHTVMENPDFAGEKTHLYVADGVLTLDNTNFMDGWGLIDDVTDWDTGTQPSVPVYGYYSTGNYDFTHSVNLGGLFVARLTANVVYSAFAQSDLFDARTDLIDDWISFDGIDVTDATVQLLVRVTQTDPAGSPVWSAWQPFFVGDWTFWGAQFSLVFTSASADHGIMVTDLSVDVTMPVRTEAANAVAVSSAGLTVTFSNAFWEAPATGITLQNAVNGDYFVLSGESATGFTIRVYDGTGTAKSATINWLSKGYGVSS